MTVSGLTMTTAVRQPVQMRESTTQRRRSALVTRSRGRVRCSTCSRVLQGQHFEMERGAGTRRSSESENSTDIIAQKRIQRQPQPQLLQKERTFQ
jgi:hypothetical protein